MVVNCFSETTKVISFNGRTGAIVPQAGDYTASMVGAATETYVNTQIGDVLGAKIKYGITDLVAGTSSLETGTFYFVYK